MKKNNINTNNTNTSNNIKNSQINAEADLYNKILKSSTKEEDKLKCNELKDINIKNICISSIEDKFDPLRSAKTNKDCENLSNRGNEKKDFRVNLCYYNLITKEPKELNDYKKCDLIKDKALKENCISMVKSKFNDESKITSLEGCDTLKETKTESKDLRQDVCRYNKIKLVVNGDNYKELCSKIKTKDINEICLNDYKNLPKLKDIPMIIPPIEFSNSGSSNSGSKTPPPIIMPY
ncbi:hypothetical protein H3C61_04590 [Candidatus Gracilibacteria bacterium]|nr:hypothetical protein [Candidatus Gracilibacteria bacterium]